MKKVKKLTAFLVSAMMLMVNSTGFADYPEGVVKENGDGTTSYIYGPWAPENQPASAITGTYPTKLHNQYGDGNSPFTNKWHTDGVVKTYSNPEKRFVVGGKNFILLDTDANGNYFVIADDLYGTKGYVTVAKETTTTSNYFQALLNGTWTYDPQNQYSVAKWLNNGFLTDGNRGEKLPEEIIANLVEKEWGVEGGSQIEDSWCYSQVGLTAPKYTSINGMGRIRLLWEM